MQGDITSLKQPMQSRETAEHEDPPRPQYNRMLPHYKTIKNIKLEPNHRV
jgi:hypothetical protein